MTERLDMDQEIAIDATGKGVKATPYFEELIFQIIEDLGGGDGNAVDDNLNLAVVPSMAAAGQLNDLTKRIQNLEQMIGALVGQVGPLQ
jgi:hypothetical protein